MSTTVSPALAAHPSPTPESPVVESPILAPPVLAPPSLDTLPLAYTLPPELEASSPPEHRGVPRDGVRMLVATKSDGALVHATFSDLPDLLQEGDLVVINTSATLPAELDATAADRTALQVHLSTRLPAGLWTLELRRHGQAKLDAEVGQTLRMAEHGRVTLLAPYAPGPGGRGVRLWVAQIEVPDLLDTYLARHGRPIGYGYTNGRYPLATYQNVYATVPGSAEMPSAGRPFTPTVVTRLVARGIGVAPLLLHTGVASLEVSEPPYPEPFRVSAQTARRVNETRLARRHVVAVGTTVVRALESVVDDDGQVHPGEGWTETVVSPTRPVRAVDGMLTGWHEPRASHLAMLEAMAGRSLLEASYAAALSSGYLWHEFGDVHLILP